MIHKLFPTPVYMVQLDPSDEVWNAMFTYVEQFRLRLQQAEEMDDSVYTGDVHSDFVIHQKEQFQWLNGQIGRHMRLYLQELGVDLTDIEIYAQKSWPTVCNKEKGEVNEHTHENAHFSCVYYLSVDESNYSGNLYFRNPNSLIVNKVPVSITNANSNSEKFHQVTPENGKLLIFPSYLPHYVSVYNGDDYRYSISYDITITARPEVAKNELQVSHHSQWTPLADTT